MAEHVIEVKNLTMGYESRVVMENLNFTVDSGTVFGILGGSGCGKSTLLKHITGLYSPWAGDILINGRSIVHADGVERRQIMREFGVTYQGGALFGSMTVAENVAMPLQEFTDMTPAQIKKRVAEKLALVGLADFGKFFPSELSGGMKKRAGLARALALEPKLLFFDEPSAGLDPISSAELDKLILSLRDNLGATVVIVTHELDSIFSIIDQVVLLDKQTKSIVDRGDPRVLREKSENSWVREFLNRAGMKGDK